MRLEAWNAATREESLTLGLRFFLEGKNAIQLLSRGKAGQKRRQFIILRPLLGDE
jgi:hypothetical protein